MDKYLQELLLLLKKYEISCLPILDFDILNSNQNKLI